MIGRETSAVNFRRDDAESKVRDFFHRQFMSLQPIHLLNPIKLTL